MMYASRSAHGAGAPRPPSPTLSNATTQASALNMNGGPDIIITRAHLRTSVATYEEVQKEALRARHTGSELCLCVCGLVALEIMLCLSRRTISFVKCICALC